ncbi:hypothetical protein PIROE2DRAFT_58696 [Piromyces sp. E2]|nr:hypothetical protein PIROE2DRAFT_58696 [Piromyces sp. E2]|eukprot:OUM67559.1 hypothetical protein PIROE2DRAFT_58696 [Piromyces sp. E2]
MLYTGLICKENNQGKGKDGNTQFDFLEYNVNYNEWKMIIKEFNNIIEEYEINSIMLDYIIRKEFKKREDEAMAELVKQNEIEKLNSEEKNENDNCENGKESSQEDSKNSKKTKQDKKKIKNLRKKRMKEREKMTVITATSENML